MAYQWFTLFSYFILNFIVGLNYFNAPKSLEILLGLEVEEDNYYIFELGFLIFYIFIAPVCFNFLWRSFYWSIWVTWMVATAGLWIKCYGKYKLDSYFLVFGHCLVLLTSIITIPACGTLTIKYFHETHHLFVLCIGYLASPIGLSFSYLSNTYLSDNRSSLVESILISFFGLLFLIFSEKDKPFIRQPYKGIQQSWKYLLKNKERKILWISTSIGQAGILSILTMFDKLEKYAYDPETICVFAISFSVFSFLGALIFFLASTTYYRFVVILKSTIFIAIIAVVFWAFSVNLQYSSMIYCVIAGVFMLGGFPLRIKALLNSGSTMLQPVMINMMFYLSTIILVLLRILILKLEEHLGISVLTSCSVIELLSATAFLSEYSPFEIEKQQDSLDNHSN